ncbi:hypothetical protein WA158_001033 [Blastocystis sp. Blastoise]
MKLTSLFVCLLLIVKVLADCEANQFPLVFVKTFSTSAAEESFKVSLASDLETSLYTFTATNSDNSQTRKYDACLANGNYVITLLDSYGDGWGTSSVSATVLLKYKDVTVDTFFMPYKSGRTYLTDSHEFTLSIGLLSGWKYTSNPQTNSAWTEAAFVDSQWTSGEVAAMPDFSSVTRYYRNTIFVADDATLIDLGVFVKTDAGIIIYVNGLEKYRYKMPSGAVTSTTSSTGVADATAAIKGVTLYKSSLIVGSSNQIAIEIHQYSTETTHADAFDTSIFFHKAASNKCFAHLTVDGVATSQHSAYSTSYGAIKAFDWSEGTMFYTANSPSSISYTFNYNSFVYVNTYSITSASTSSYGYPKSWTLYGSRDGGNTWFYLDDQTNSGFSTYKVSKTYYINTNSLAFNSFKFDITANTISGKSSVGDINLQACNIPISVPSFGYSVTSINTQLGSQDLNLKPAVGYMNYAVTPDFVSGVTLDPNTGIISGSPNGSVNQIYHITATNPIDGQTVSTDITLVVTPCSQPTYQPIVLLKTNKGSATQEKFTIKDSTNTTVFDSDYGINSSDETFNLCAPADLLTIELFDTNNNGWTSNSYLYVKLRVGNDLVTQGRFNLFEKSYGIYTVDLRLPIYYGSHSWKYVKGSVPNNWYMSTFVPSNWATLGETAPSNDAKLWLFRNTFSIANITSYHSFTVNLRALSGYVIYINDQELYRYNLPAGPISIATEPTGSESSISMFTISAPTSLLKVGTPNTIAIGLVNMETLSTIDFDCFIQLDKNSVSLTRSFDVSATSTGVFDNSQYTYWSTNTPKDTELSISASFNNHRAEFINKYCIINYSSGHLYDPSSFSIDASDNGETWTPLDREDNVMFDSSKQRKCFYLTLNTKPWNQYKLRLYKSYNGLEKYYYSIMEVELLTEDISQLIVPEFYMTPSYIEAYQGVEFPTMIESHDVYRDYTITPALPSGLELDTTNGNIRGNTVEVFNNTYTLTAKDHLRRSHTTTIRIATVNCNTPNLLLTLQFSGTATGDEMGFYLYNLNYTQTIDYRNNLIKSDNILFHYCIPVGVYNLQLSDSGYNGWDGGSYKALIDQTSVISSGTLKNNEGYKTILLNLGYLVKPGTHSWYYSNQNENIPANWYTATTDTNRWSSALTNKIPSSTTITQYYKTFVNVENSLAQRFSVVEFSVKFRCGCRLFVNGKEVKRYNMDIPDEQEISKNTLATSSFNIIQWVQHSESGQFGSFHDGVNVIGVELHKCTATGVADAFDFSVRFAEGESNRLAAGDFTVFGDIMNDWSYYPAKNLFDDDYYTTAESGPRCVGATYGIQFNNNKADYVNGYRVTTVSRCNYRNPTGWVVYGSNDMKKWDVLHSVNDLYTYYNPAIYNYEFITTNSYNAFKFEVTSCYNTPVDSMEYSNCYYANDFSSYDGSWGFHLGDFVFTTKKLGNTCDRVDGYTAAVNNGYATKECDLYYAGKLQRKCTDGVLGPVQDYCTPDVPASISYSKKVSSFTVGKTIVPLVATVAGAEYTCTIEPELPIGMMFDTETGSISGTPNNELEASSYYITCSNSAGEVSTEIIFSVVQGESLPIVEYIIVGVFIILAALVLILIIVKRTSSAQSKRKIQTSKKNSSTMESKPVVV